VQNALFVVKRCLENYFWVDLFQSYRVGNDEI